MDNILVVYRFTTDELHEFMDKINKACEVPKESSMPQIGSQDSKKSQKKSPKIPKLKPDAVSFNFNPNLVDQREVQ